jgi:hypothetical protein
MAELDKGKTVSLLELMVSTLAMTDALAKLLIEKGVITDAEFKQKLLEESVSAFFIRERSNRSGETKTATCLNASSLRGELMGKY